MLIYGQEGRDHGRMVHGTGKKVACSNQLTVEQHGKNYPEDYPLPIRVWEGLVFALHLPTPIVYTPQLMQENMVAFTAAMMQAKAGTISMQMKGCGEEEVILQK